MQSLRQGVPGEWEKERVNDVLAQFVVSRETLESVMLKFNEDFTLGLSSEQTKRDQSPVKMLPTYVRSIPDGTEEGDYFALDLGGTNFRVLLVSIKNNQISMSHKTYPMGSAIMEGTAENLFGYIAQCLAAFGKEKLGEDLKKIAAVGFTFSFPVEQTSLTSGNLIKWTKGYNVAGVEGNDIIKLLTDAIKRRKEIEVEQIALLNDTTGVMMSCAFYDQAVAIGLILGTGTNACYMEDISNVKKWDGDHNKPKQVIVNTEWGAFGEKGELRCVATQFDDIVDQESLYPGQQLYEKMISGMYLGEIVRQCLLHLIKMFVLFRGKVSSQLAVQNSFLTMYVSDFCSGEVKNIHEILKLLGYEQATLFECQVIQDVCNAVSLRAARLAAAGLTTIVRRLDKNSLTVAVDGSLFKKHPTFKRFMYEALDELLPTTQVKLRLAEDGSGQGAALVAAVANRLSKK